MPPQAKSDLPGTVLGVSSGFQTEKPENEHWSPITCIIQWRFLQSSCLLPLALPLRIKQLQARSSPSPSARGEKGVSTLLVNKRVVSCTFWHRGFVLASFPTWLFDMHHAFNSPVDCLVLSKPNKLCNVSILSCNSSYSGIAFPKTSLFFNCSAAYRGVCFHAGLL